MLGAAEHWSERIKATRERSAQAATTQMGRMGAEAASFILRRTA